MMEKDYRKPSELYQEVFLIRCSSKDGKKQGECYESFTVPIHHVQPTQLYISEVKLKKVRTYLENADFNSLDPLPVKR